MCWSGSVPHSWASPVWLDAASALREVAAANPAVLEVEGDTLTIWGGEWGSPAYYRGIFSKDGTTLTGAWHYPGGGGYEATSTRVE